MSLKEQLLNDEGKIGVFGTGYIGFSLLAFFAKEGVKGIGYDVDPIKVKEINARCIPTKDLEKWLGFDINFDLIEATANYKRLEECNPIFIAVPTEKGTAPWFDALKSTISKLNTFKEKKLVIVESTLDPRIHKEVILPKFKHDLIISPRRDWIGFGSERSKTLASLPKIVGGMSKTTLKDAIDVYSIVCKELLTCTVEEALLVKAVENGIRALDIAFANQLMLAYPDINVRRVLELAGTKWNVETYYPGICSPGGYCISMACFYLYWGAQDKSLLSIMRAVLNYEPQHVANVMEKIVEKFKPKRIGLLGFSYIGNIKVNIMSACLGIIDFLDAERIPYAVHDPLYSKEELQNRSIETFEYPDDMEQFDMLILTAGHDYYKGVKPNYSGVVIDATGIWEKWRDSFKEYVLIGEPF